MGVQPSSLSHYARIIVQAALICIKDPVAGPRAERRHRQGMEEFSRIEPARRFRFIAEPVE
jgi:hypothetical protein